MTGRQLTKNVIASFCA